VFSGDEGLCDENRATCRLCFVAEIESLLKLLLVERMLPGMSDDDVDGDKYGDESTDTERCLVEGKLFPPSSRFFALFISSSIGSSKRLVRSFRRKGGGTNLCLLMGVDVVFNSRTTLSSCEMTPLTTCFEDTHSSRSEISRWRLHCNNKTIELAKKPQAPLISASSDVTSIFAATHRQCATI
jgi:hypothetical protein